jgi:hypothetical protein
VILVISLGPGLGFTFGQPVQKRPRMKSNSPISDCIGSFISKYDTRFTRGILLRGAPIGLSNDVPASCSLSDYVPIDLGLCLQEILQTLTSFEDFQKAAAREDFTEDKKQKIHQLIMDKFGNMSQNLKHKCNLTPLAEIKTKCAKSLYDL